nr:hypothetical protein [Tanacetum cinerariifolium]
MATTIEQQTALDESLVPSTQRAFQVTADVPEIYMQEFWTTAKLHHNSIRFKINTRKSAKALELKVSDCLKLKCYGDSITTSTLTLPISYGKILCIRWSTKVRREAMK